MAVTSIAASTGRPTSWSSGVDQLCYDESRRRLFVVAAGNPDKRGSLLSLQQRQQLIEMSTTHLPNVVAWAHTGLVVDFADRLGVDVLVRSMGKEQRSELQMAATNEILSRLPTLFFAPRAATAHISSRMVREQLSCDGIGDIGDLVPEPVVALLTNLAAMTTAARRT
jgi:pantetheine-phosphate adenylyltransferase